MPKDFSQLQIGVPDLGDRGTLLKTLGTIVAKEIAAMIRRRERPDGSPQTENRPGYSEAKRKKKGYSTPLMGMSDNSPYLARTEGQTFLRTLVSEDTLIVHLNAKRAEIGERLTDKGYWFMGITDKAEWQIKDRVVKWKNNKIAQMRRNAHG